LIYYLIVDIIYLLRFDSIAGDKQLNRERVRASQLIAAEVFFITTINWGGRFDIRIATRQFRQMTKQETICQRRIRLC
jgi:hypothetical protein